MRIVKTLGKNLLALFGEDVEYRISRKGGIDIWVQIHSHSDILRIVEGLTGETCPDADDPRDCRLNWKKIRNKWTPAKFIGNRTPKVTNRKRLGQSYHNTAGPVWGVRTMLLRANGLLGDGSHGLLALWDYSVAGGLIDHELHFRLLPGEGAWQYVDQGVPRTLADQLEVRGLPLSMAPAIGTTLSIACRLLAGTDASGGGKPKLDVLDSVGGGPRELLPSDIEGLAFAEGGLLAPVLTIIQETYPSIPEVGARPMPWVLLGIVEAVLALPTGKGVKDTQIASMLDDDAPGWLIRSIGGGGLKAMLAVSAFLRGLKAPEKRPLPVWTQAYDTWFQEWAEVVEETPEE